MVYEGFLMNAADLPGVIESGHLYVAKEARQRLRLGPTAWRKLCNRGLHVIREGRQAYVLGDDLIRLFGAQGRGGNE